MEINVRRWGVFNAVGIGGFVVQLCAIALLTRRFGWPAFAATTVALELTALQNFVAHSRWTWGDRPVPRTVEGPATHLRGWLRRYWRYQVAKTASLAANLVITTLLIHAGLPPEIANTAAVLACAIPNFLVSERFVFS
ncbi:MAG: GtrA family protein [Vicinamibacterales bacterium]